MLEKWIINVLIVGGLTWVMVVFGSLVIRSAFSFACNRAFLFGAGYFMGMGILLAEVRLLTSMGRDFRLALLFTMITLCGWMAIRMPVLRHGQAWQWSSHVKISVLIVGWYLVFTGMWLFPEGSIRDPLTFHGSLHTGRYAPLAEFIFSTNTIPVLNQNTGQSILTAITLVMGSSGAGWVLHAWLFVSSVFLMSFFYGVLIVLGLPRRFAVMGTLILMLGNTSLSLAHVLVYDALNPWLLNGYTDAMAAISTCLVFVLVVLHPDATLNQGTTTWPKIGMVLLIPFCMGIFWHQVGAHMFVILYPILGTGFLLLLWKRLPLPKAIGWVAFLLLAGSLAGVLHGGMLTPKFLRSAVKIEGTMETHKAQLDERRFTLFNDYVYHEEGVAINIFYPYVYSRIPLEYSLPKYQLFGYDTRKLWLGRWQEFLINMEQELWNTLRVLFFPVVGVMLFGWRAWSHREEAMRTFHLTLSGVAFLALFGGGLMAFLIQYSGYKWELSRFVMIGITLGMILFVLTLYDLTMKWHASRRDVFWVIFCSLIIFGPVNNIVNGPLVQNLYELAIHFVLPDRPKAARGEPPDLYNSNVMERYQMMLQHVYNP